MKKLTPDPELEALVRELNDVAPSGGDEGEGSGGTGRNPRDFPALQVAEGNALEKLLIEVAQRGASDLHLVVGVPPVFRIGGRLTRAGDPLSSDDIHALLSGVLSARMREKIEAEG